MTGVAQDASHFLASLLVMACLAGCSNGPEGAKGDPGQPGAAGPEGMPGPAGIHVVRGTCIPACCAVECGENEIAIIAWCGAARTPAIFPAERSASCRGRGIANNRLVAVCANSEDR
jgi:hypothetical protein